MVTIIHGGHRNGLCLNAALEFEQMLIARKCKVNLFDLRIFHTEFCCGEQPCQVSGRCVHTDMMTEEIIPAIALSDFLVIFTPTYFNMPPALLKNFIDRCNVLLMLENRKPLGIATWISGQADECSLEACFRCLSSFAEVCEYTLIHECKILRIESCLNHTNILLADIKKLEKLAQIICP